MSRKVTWLVVVALALAFAAGFGVREAMARWSGSGAKTPAPVPDAIAATRADNEFQVALRRRPSVAAFENALTAAAEDRWADAFALIGPAWRERVKTPDGLKRDYRTTKEHWFRYYIPLRIEENLEEYLVDLEFADWVPELPGRRAILGRPLAATLQPHVIDELVAELSAEARKAFVFPTAEDPAELAQAELYDYVRNTTLQELADRVEIVDSIGTALHLEPIVQTGWSPAGEIRATHMRRIVRVTLVRTPDDFQGPMRQARGRWRLDSYASIMRDN